MMRVRFWGTRGSLPVALTAAGVREKLLNALRAARGRPLATEADLKQVLASLPFATSGTYGGHSACVQLETDSFDYFVCDMGSGLRPFGQAAMAQRAGSGQTFHIFQSHLHWDHIMGLPFFVPAFIPGNRVVIYGCHEGLEAALRRQQDTPSFPVDFSIFGAALEFVRLEPGKRYDISGVGVTPMLQRHGGDSYGFRFEHDGRMPGQPPTIVAHDLRRSGSAVLRILAGPPQTPGTAVGWRDQRLRERPGDQVGPEIDAQQPLVRRDLSAVTKHERFRRKDGAVHRSGTRSHETSIPTAQRDQILM